MALRDLFSQFLPRGGKPVATRSLDAAGGGRRWADDRRMISASTLHSAAPIIAARAAQFAINTATGMRITETLVANLVGDGITPRSQHPDKDTRKALHDAWKLWLDTADADGRRDFFGLQQDACRDLVTFGEFVFIILQDPETGSPQLRRLHPEQLDRSITRPTGDGGHILQGVEFDRFGRVHAYWLRQSGPGDPLAQLAVPAKRFTASVVLHGFKPIYPGQVRGISWFAPILVSANQLDQLQDAGIERAKVAALHAGFVRDAQGAGSPYTGERQADGSDMASMEPGAIVRLPPGTDIEFSDVPDQTGAIELMRMVMRQIASGIGVTYEMLSGDYSNVNYSSARAGINEFRRFASAVQFNQLIFPFCRPAWRRFVAFQAFKRNIDLAAFAADPAPFDAVKFLPPAWLGVDPEKDAKANEIELRNRFKSRSEIIAERGYDAEDVDAEIAADEARSPTTSSAKEPVSKEEEQADAA